MRHRYLYLAAPPSRHLHDWVRKQAPSGGEGAWLKTLSDMGSPPGGEAAAASMGSLGLLFADEAFAAECAEFYPSEEFISSVSEAIDLMRAKAPVGGLNQYGG